MFKPNGKDDFEDVNSAEDTIIGSSIKIEGDLVSNGSIVVEGKVKGSLKTDKTLRVGERAEVTADVSAKEALISGKVDGNIVVQDKLELTETAEVNGDIKAGTLTITAGAVFNGNCSMGDAKPAVKAKEVVEEEE